MDEPTENKEYIAPKDLHVNSDYSALVPTNHPDSAYLLAPKGQPVPEEYVQRFGLRERDPMVIELEYRVRRQMEDHAARIRETDLTFRVDVTSHLFVAEVVDILQEHQIYDLPDGSAQVSFNVRRKDVPVHGRTETYIYVDAYVVHSEPGDRPIHEYRNAINIIIKPIRAEACKVNTICHGAYARAFYDNVLLPSLGETYPESGLATSTQLLAAQGGPTRGQNQDRDETIYRLHTQGRKLSVATLAKKYRLSERRISQIIATQRQAAGQEAKSVKTEGEMK